VATLIKALVRLAQEVIRRRAGLRQAEAQGPGGQVVEQGGEAVEEQRQVVLDAGEGQALLQAAHELAPGGVEMLAPGLARVLDARVVERVLARRQQVERLDGLQAALGLRVEQAQGFDLVVEQVHAHRQGLAARKQVEDRPAHGEFAMFHHLGDAAVAGVGQALAEGLHVQSRWPLASWMVRPRT